MLKIRSPILLEHSEQDGGDAASLGLPKIATARGVAIAFFFAVLI
ncbi:hypothetical protein [Moorena producens]|nr:hypothetical protein [Moorena producens]